jgi:hypothetical protein
VYVRLVYLYVEHIVFLYVIGACYGVCMHSYTSTYTYTQQIILSSAFMALFAIGAYWGMVNHMHAFIRKYIHTHIHTVSTSFYHPQFVVIFAISANWGIVTDMHAFIRKYIHAYIHSTDHSIVRIHGSLCNWRVLGHGQSHGLRSHGHLRQRKEKSTYL